MSELKWAYDTIALDTATMVETDEELIFKDVVLAKEIVQDYDDGKAHKTADELEAYYWTAEGRWATSGGHPMIGIITKRDEIHGQTKNVRFVKNLKCPVTDRPNMRGVRGDLHVFKNMVASSVINDLKTGKKPAVSIGFFYKMDATPGEWNGIAYDYVQRDMMHDHLAFAIDSGRCPWPQCGIGADEMLRRVAGDPFADYESFSDCVSDIMAKNPSYTEEEAQATCAKIEEQSKEKDNMSERVDINMQSQTEETLTSAFKVLISDILIEILDKPVKDEPRTEAERAMSHFDLTEEEWEALSEEEKEEKIEALPERGSGGDDDQTITVDTVANDLTIEQIDAKIEELQNKQLELRKEITPLEDELWGETEAEKTRNKEIRVELNTIYVELDKLWDELSIYKEAKAIVIANQISEDEEPEPEKDPPPPPEDPPKRDIVEEAKKELELSKEYLKNFE